MARGWCCAGAACRERGCSSLYLPLRDGVLQRALGDPIATRRQLIEARDFEEGAEPDQLDAGPLGQELQGLVLALADVFAAAGLAVVILAARGEIEQCAGRVPLAIGDRAAIRLDRVFRPRRIEGQRQRRALAM